MAPAVPADGGLMAVGWHCWQAGKVASQACNHGRRRVCRGRRLCTAQHWQGMAGDMALCRHMVDIYTARQMTAARRCQAQRPQNKPRAGGSKVRPGCLGTGLVVSSGRCVWVHVGPCSGRAFPPASRLVFSCGLAAATPALVPSTSHSHQPTLAVLRSTRRSLPRHQQLYHQFIFIPPPHSPHHTSQDAFLYLRHLRRCRHWRPGPSPGRPAHHSDLRRPDPGKLQSLAWCVNSRLTLERLLPLPAPLLPLTRSLRFRLPLTFSPP